MHRFSFVFLLCTVSVSVFAQTTPKLKYLPGTVIAVERHEETDPAVTQTRYDVTVQIEDTVYVVLYAPRYGMNTVEYSVGIEKLFGVGTDALILPGRDDRQEELPILLTKKLPPRPAIDWSKAPGQYFSMKMKNLTTSLNLTDDQQAKVKPIAEQEAAEASSVIFTPVVSRKERLGQWEKIIRKSDAKLKTILTDAQWQRLLEIRKDQKRELRDLIAKQDKAGVK